MNKNKKLIKTVAQAVTVTLVVGSIVGCSTTSMSTMSSGQEAADQLQTQQDLANTLSSIVEKEQVSYVQKNTRKETVYVFDNASGDTSHITVSTKVTDENGKQTTTNTESTNQAPVDIKVTYTLDGKEISPDQLAGKSGNVQIRFDYTNNEKTTMTVKDEEKTAYVPFTVVSGMLLDSEKFSNIEVTNGTIEQVADNYLIMGVAMPGLSDTLDLQFDGKDLDLEIPEYFEVSADVVDFSLDMTMSVATASLFNSFDLEDVNLDNITEKIDELADAANQIMDGSADLADGTKKLNDSMPDLKDGVTKLDEGAGALNEGATALDNGAASLKDGATKLDAGAGDIKDGAAALDDGASSLKDGAGNLSDGVNKVSDAVGQLSAGATSLDSSMKEYSSSVNTLTNTLKENGFDTSVTALANGAASLNDGINGESGLLATLSATLSEQKDNYDTYYKQAYQLVFDAKLAQAIAAFVADNSYGITSAEQVYKNEAILTNIQQQVTEGLATAGITEEPKLSSVLENEAANQSVYITAGLSSAYSTYATLATAAAAEGQSQKAATYQEYANNAMKLILAMNQTIGAYKAAYGSYQAISTSGLANGVTQLTNGLSTLEASIGSFATNKEGTLCTSLAAVAAAASKLQTEGSAALSTGLCTLNDSMSTLTDGATTLKKGASDLKDGTAALKDGASTLKDGTSSLKDGASTLKDGTSSLMKGTSDLKDGTETLLSSTNTLIDGVVQLNDGAAKLHDGIVEFNESGIQKIKNLAEVDGEVLLDTVKGLFDLGKNYTSFTGVSDDKDASVIFIYKTAGIE